MQSALRGQEDDVLLLLVLSQSAAQLFEMMHLDGFAVPNTDAGIRTHLLQKIRQLSLQPGKILLHGFLPDESVLVGGRLNLGTVVNVNEKVSHVTMNF